MSKTTIQNTKEKIIPVLRAHGVIRSAFFGSFVRGQRRRGSDIDILVDLPRGKTLFDFIELQKALEKKIKYPVDLVTYRSLSPYLKKSIQKEQVPIL